MAKIVKKERERSKFGDFTLRRKRKKFGTQRRKERGKEERKERGKERAFVRVEATGLGTANRDHPRFPINSSCFHSSVVLF